MGHLARACYRPQPRTQEQTGFTAKGQQTGQQRKGNIRQVTDNPSEQLADIVTIHTVTKGLPDSYKVIMEVNKQPIKMELDTGAIVSLVSEVTWTQELQKPALKPCPFMLKGYPNNKLDILGMCQVHVTVGGVTKQLPLVVCKGSGLSLLGRNWLEELKLNWQEIARINGVTKPSADSLNKLLTEYADVFNPGLGHCKDVNAKLYLKDKAVPKFNRPRPTALAMKPKIEEELHRQEELGVLERVDTAEWAAPVVPVIKPTGAIRLCGDYKVSVNPHLEVNKYPLPHPEEIFTALNGGEKFTKLDLSEAYLQIPLDEQSRNLVVINTHKGLYRFTRLPYGVASAPSIFQQIMDQILPKQEGIICYLDDILITGKNDQQHLGNLKAVLAKLQQHQLRIKKSKCCFFQDKVEFLGKVVTKEGIATSSRKVSAVLQIAPPENLTQLRSFLGIVNHYRKFVPLLADLSDPLNRLLKKDTPWKWSEECQQSFIKLKEALTSTAVLTHYDPKVKIALACDASSTGIGAVIYHVYQDGTEKPIAYASKTLSSAERNYSQIEKEALSLIFGVKKFHNFLYGRHFLLVTDHKPLLTIFGSKKGIPTVAANRLQRWAIILASYTYEIQYKPTGKHGNADTLSRFPVSNDQHFEQDYSLASELNCIHSFQLEKLPLRATDVAKATRDDAILSQVHHFIQQGWPKSKSLLEKPLHPYFVRRLQLTVQSGCILNGLQVVILSSLRKVVLTELHEAHTEIVKMKSVARMYVWWPTINQEIEDCTRQCHHCQYYKRDPAKAPNHPWEQPKDPWERLHIDFAGPFKGSMWLILVDALTKWPEVVQMSSTSSERTIEVLRSLFSRYGVPRTIVSDNGTQFTSALFTQFCKGNGIHHKLSAPYHPSTNGEAERFVQTFKASIKANENDLQISLCQFLMKYRSSPHASTRKTPASMMFNREITTRLSLLFPTKESEVSKGPEEETFQEARKFRVKDPVWIRVYSGSSKWSAGVIVEKYGPCNYKVQMGQKLFKRHVDQLRYRYSDYSNASIPNDFDDFPSSPDLVTQTCPRYPDRARHPPDILTY